MWHEANQIQLHGWDVLSQSCRGCRDGYRRASTGQPRPGSLGKAPSHHLLPRVLRLSLPYVFTVAELSGAWTRPAAPCLPHPSWPRACGGYRLRGKGRREGYSLGLLFIPPCFNPKAHLHHICSLCHFLQDPGRKKDSCWVGGHKSKTFLAI